MATTIKVVNDVSNVRLSVWLILVLIISDVRSGTLASHFTNSVKHDDRIVERVTDDRQEGCHNRQADPELIDQQEPERFGQIGTDRNRTQGDQDVVDQCDDGRQAEHDSLEANPDIANDAEQAGDQSRDSQIARVAGHLATDLAGRREDRSVARSVSIWARTPIISSDTRMRMYQSWREAHFPGPN